MVSDTVVAEELTAMRKAFLYEKTHSYNLRTGLPAEMNNTACGMPVRQEIINEDNTVIFGQKLLADTNGGVIRFGEFIFSPFSGVKLQK